MPERNSTGSVRSKPADRPGHVRLPWLEYPVPGDGVKIPEMRRPKNTIFFYKSSKLDLKCPVGVQAKQTEVSM